MESKKWFAFENRLLDSSHSPMLYKKLVDTAISLLRIERGVILLPDGQTFKHHYVKQKDLAAPITARQKGFSYKAFITGEPNMYGEEEVVQYHPELVRSGLKSFAVVPITYHKQCKGIFHFSSKKENYFTPERMDLLKAYGRHAYFLLKNLDAYTELQKTLENRDLFMSMTAHELKNPLTAIKIYNQLVMKKLSQQQLPDLSTLAMLDKEISRLAQLVHEYLGSQFTKGILLFNTKKCSLETVITTAIRNVLTVYPDHTFRFHNKATRTITTADENKIQQVIINILNNAAKFCPRDKPIIVTLQKTRESFSISIRDKGPGIRKQDLERIFDRFYKGKHNVKEGMGLGLYLAKNIIDAHKGTIGISSRFGKGTTVKITLPRT
jgi:K+-sensing histidine kinase KdpD